MTDTQQTATSKPKRTQQADRQWIDPQGKEVASGEEARATGLRYIHLPTAKKLDPAYDPEKEGAVAPAAAVFDYPDIPEPAKTMLAVFGGLTLAGNVVNTWNGLNDADRPENPVDAIKARFQDLEDGKWIERVGGVGGVRYDAEKLALAIAQAKGESDPAPYAAKMANKVDPKTGAPATPDQKGAISYGAFALRNAAVKAKYDALTGGGVQLGQL